MESLAYYESEDEQEIENSSKIRDVSPSPMNKQRDEVTLASSSSHARTPSTSSRNRKEHLQNDNSFQTHLSEDSDGTSSGGGKIRSHYKKSENYETREKPETSGYRRHSDEEKKSKVRDQQRDRDYDKRDYNKTNDRERFSKNRYRDDRSVPDRYSRESKSRSNRDESHRDRDKERGERNRDRDRFSRDRSERHRNRGDYERDRDRDAHRSNRNQSYDKYKDREPYDKYKERGSELKGRERERPIETKEFNKRHSVSPRGEKKETKSSSEACLPIRPVPQAPSLIEVSSNSLVVSALPLETTSNNINLNFIERRKEKVQQLEKMGIDIKSATIKPGVELPSYYNPGVINPTRYADQVQKRKLLWSHKKNEQEQAAAKWETAKFSQDQDGKVASKFMRLMGIKDAPQKPPGESSKTQDLTKKQEELFSTMEQQYEVARQVTHTMRGVGLGFGSQPRQF